MLVEPSAKRLPARRAFVREIERGRDATGHERTLFTPQAGPTTAALLVGAIAAAGLQQGGFFTRGQVAAGALVAAAVVSTARLRWGRADLRAPLLTTGLLAAWALFGAVPDGSTASAVREALLLGGLATVLVVCGALSEAGRRLLLFGLLGFGVLVAMTGWAGVVWRVQPWALPGQGLWRAASTISYANATAAVVVPLALVTLALLTTRRRSIALSLILMVLLLSLALTLSRAGALAMMVGVALLVVARGWRVLLAGVAPLLGVLVAGGGLLPSLPVATQPRPVLAILSLFAGLAVTTVFVGWGRHRGPAAAVTLILIASVCTVSIAGQASIRKAGERVWHHRVHTSSPNRSATSAAALRLLSAHPLTGVGPGRLRLETRDGGRLRVQHYTHNEYVQVLAELGVIGAALLAALVACIGRLVWRSPLRRSCPELWAGALAAGAAAAVHAGFDFVWHVPVVPLTLAALIGLMVASAEGGPNERRPS